MFIKINNINRIIFLLFSFFLSYMANATESIDNGEDLVKSIVLEVYCEGKINFIDHAIKICNLVILDLENALISLNKKTRDRGEVSKEILMGKYYPCPQSKHLKSGQIFIEADQLSWRMISNSLNFAKNNNEDVTRVIHECARFVCTAAHDSYNFKNHSHYPPYFFTRLDCIQDVIASLLCEIDFKSNMPFYERDDNVIGMFYKMSNNKNFHYSRLLASFSKLEDEEMNSLLDVDSEEIEKLKGCQTKNIEDPNLLVKLRTLNLFKILDCNERKKYIYKFDLLNNYHFYLGSIDEFLLSDYQSCLKYFEDHSFEEKNKQKASYASKKKKTAKKPRNNSRKKKIETIQKNPEMNSSVENSEFENTGYFENTVDEEGWTLVGRQGKKEPKNQKHQVDASISLTNNHIHEENRLHYLNYVHSRNIFESRELSYHYNGIFVDTRTHFDSMRENINQQNSLNIIEYIAKQNDHKHIRTPNIAQFFITFHLLINGENCEKTYSDKDVYLSGAQLFRDKNDPFKINNHIKLAYHDALTSEEKNKYWETTDIRQLYLKKVMMDKIFKRIVGGRWLFNSLDSEPSILLDLLDNKLSTYLDDLGQTGNNFEIQGVVLGISSLYESCFRCRNLVQGFQWKLKRHLSDLIKGMGLYENIVLSENFNSLVLFEGQKPVKYSDDPLSKSCLTGQSSLPFLRSNDTESSSKHKFAFSQKW